MWYFFIIFSSMSVSHFWHLLFIWDKMIYKNETNGSIPKNNFDIAISSIVTQLLLDATDKIFPRIFRYFKQQCWWRDRKWFLGSFVFIRRGIHAIFNPIIGLAPGHITVLAMALLSRFSLGVISHLQLNALLTGTSHTASITWKKAEDIYSDSHVHCKAYAKSNSGRYFFVGGGGWGGVGKREGKEGGEEKGKVKVGDVAE